MKLTYRFVFSLLLFFSITAVFSQNLSDQEIGFDAARITAALKKRGMTDQNIQEEIALMRKVQNEQYIVMKKGEDEQYAAMKKKEDEILQKIISKQTLKAETNKTANTGLTAKTTNTLADIPQTEKDALLALYNSTNGNNWTNKTGWDFSTPVTSGWYGITVTGGHVTGIILSNNKLSGTIPAAIGQLTELQNLWLNNNQLNGTIPSSIGQLTKITRLYLHNNQLSGAIPAEIGLLTQILELFLYNNQLSGTIPASVGQLTQLQTLYLSVNQLSGAIPPQIGQLTKLTSLYLNQNQFSGTIPAEIGQLTKLILLYLHTNQLSGTIPAEIGQLTQLTSIFLGSNKLSGTIPAAIGQLTQLQILSLYTNKLSGTIPAEIGQLTQLNTLYLNDNQLTGSIPAEIGQLTKLQILSLTTNQLSGTIPSSIGQLTKLTILYLHNNQLSGTIPVSIGQLTQLQTLYLYANQLSGTIPASIGQLTQLQNLQLNNNQLTGTIPASIGLLTKLTILYLHGNQLSGTIPVEIGLLTKLIFLSLHTNQLSGKIPTVIGQLTQLQTLYLNSNQLTGTIPAQIGQLTQLQNLSLYTNQLNGTIPAQIGLLTKLTSLQLHGNQLSGSIPTQIGQLTQLQTLYLNNNQLTGTIPAVIGQLTKLTRLYLHSNQLSGTIPSEIGQLTQVLEIYLYNNKLIGSIPTQIGQLTKLTSLYLHQNQLSGKIPAEIGQLTQLLNLNLYNNQLTGSIPNEIGQLIQLQSLNLILNQLSGTIPASIGQLTKLQSLYLNNNQLSGSIPASIGQLTELKNLQFYTNQLEGKIPNLTNVISNLNFQYNKFRFVDFVSEYTAYKNKLTLFEYSDQAKTDSENTIKKVVGETQTLTMYEDNQFTPSDTYQWYKNGQAISGATSRQYTLANLTLANAGDYYCISKNPQMTITTVTNQNFTLTRNTIHLSVANCNAILSSVVGTDTQTICNSAAIAPITYTTAGLITGATFSGLPAGVTGDFTSNTVTISGTPSYAGTFPYTVTYTGDCGSTVTSKGTIAVSVETVNAASAAPVVCTNTALAPITHSTLGGTWTPGTPSGLPAGVTAAWASNIVTISGTPTTPGVFNYNIPLLSGCGNTINATGTITVSDPGIITLSSATGTDDQSKNVNTIITPVTYTTTGATGATITGLPAGVTGNFASNMVTISGTPTVSGAFNYLITLIGDCGTTATGKITTLCEPITGMIKINTGSTVPGYPFQFSGSGKSSSTLACNETTFPLTFYAATTTIGLNTQLYTSANLTTPVTNGNLWYKSQGNATSYKIDSTGKIIENVSCTPSSYAFQFSNPGRTSASLACAQTSFTNTFYATTSTLGIGTQLYTNPSLTTPVGSDNLWYQYGVEGISYRIDNSGKTAEGTVCAGQTEPAIRTYSYRAMHPIDHTGTDSVIYIDENDIQQEHVLTRTVDGIAPCEQIVAKRIILTTGASNCDLGN